MIEIRNIKELEAERDRQRKTWIEAGKEEYEFCLSLEGADLIRADLICSFFYQANLSGADLSWANLSMADFREANLTEANLRGANFYGANFKKANLRGADLTGAYLIEAALIWCDLTEVDLRGAYLTEADGVDDFGVVYLKVANFSGAKIKDTIITQSQYYELAKLYSHEFMGGFIIKDMEVTQ